MEPQTLYDESKKGTRQVFLMNQDQIDHYWSDIEQVLGEVPGYYMFFTPEWTYARAKSKDLQIWGFSDGEIRGIAVTQILIFPAMKAFEVLGSGGVGMLDFIDEMDAVFERIAADAKCDTIIIRARPGLARALVRKHRAVEGAVWLYRKVGKKTEN